MPCHPARARALLDSGRAVVARQAPFTIRLKDRTRAELRRRGRTAAPRPRLQSDGHRDHRRVQETDPQARAPSSAGGWSRSNSGTAATRSARGCCTAPATAAAALGTSPVPGTSIVNRTRPRLAPPVLASPHRLHHVARHATVPVCTGCRDPRGTGRLRYPRLRGVRPVIGGGATRHARRIRDPRVPYAKWNRSCAYCDATGVPLDIEHVRPRSRGGSDRMSNLVLACVPCNQAKGSHARRTISSGQPTRLSRRSSTSQETAPGRSPS